MPWQEIGVSDARRRFVLECLRSGRSKTELCEAFGISRKTDYKWLARHAAEGLAGLEDRSHAPLRPARATPDEIVAAMVEMKRACPHWGPRKILDRLRDRDPGTAWPSDSTGDAILRRLGLVTPRRLRRRAPPRLDPLSEPTHPNRVWAVDHKGWIRLRDGTRCEPLTITDGFSRYLVGLFATSSVREEEARPCFERAFREHGLPETIRSDNGAPFASAGVTGLTALSVWWAKLGVAHERIDPGCPQQNGAHERFHRTLGEAMRPAGANAREQARRFAAFRQAYNEERPHEAVGRKPPARSYEASPRAMPSRLPEPDYPAEGAVRRVRSNGEIKWRGELVHVSSALAGEPVCVEETETGDWRLRFYDRTLGYIDPILNRLRARPFRTADKANNHAPDCNPSSRANL